MLGTDTYSPPDLGSPGDMLLDDEVVTQEQMDIAEQLQEEDTLADAQDDEDEEKEIVDEDERHALIRRLRLQFCVRPEFEVTKTMIFPDGRLNQEYFLPKMKDGKIDMAQYTIVDGDAPLVGMLGKGDANGASMARAASGDSDAAAAPQPSRKGDAMDEDSTTSGKEDVSMKDETTSTGAEDDENDDSDQDSSSDDDISSDSDASDQDDMDHDTPAIGTDGASTDADDKDSGRFALK
ncbi:hypothetical protein BC940DRAFT_320517 [Gongronella butleri]|nr:hypothetical protein BC940DRAFT_320517 [Gongronella butleri]